MHVRPLRIPHMRPRLRRGKLHELCLVLCVQPVRADSSVQLRGFGGQLAIVEGKPTLVVWARPGCRNARRIRGGEDRQKAQRHALRATKSMAAWSALICPAAATSHGHRPVDRRGRGRQRSEGEIKIGAVVVSSIIGGTDHALLPSNLTPSHIPAPSAFVSLHFFTSTSWPTLRATSEVAGEPRLDLSLT